MGFKDSRGWMGYLKNLQLGWVDIIGIYIIQIMKSYVMIIGYFRSSYEES